MLLTYLVSMLVCAKLAQRDWWLMDTKNKMLEGIRAVCPVWNTLYAVAALWWLYKENT